MAVDAPGGFESLACNSVCAFDTANDTWTCDTNVVCGAMNNGADATAVHNFAGTGADYSAWGQCRSNGSFCCAHTEQQAPDKVYHVELLGTPEWDILSFHHAATASNLRPARSHDLTGSIFGNENGIEIIGELITGSNYAGDDYRDFLYGEGGEDTINGMADGDWIEGGDHDDTISGGTGADVIYGGDGNDTCAGDAGNDKLEGDDGDDSLSGGDDNDAVCDSTGILVCAVNGDNQLVGSLGTDVLWYDTTATCPVAATLSMGSSAGGEMNEECGDDATYPGGWGGCDLPITTKPAVCP